jgi:small subunit ribosomal protein S11
MAKDKEIKEEIKEKKEVKEIEQEPAEIEEITEEIQEEQAKPKSKEGKTGIAYIFSSSNNTIVHITDLAGSTISRISGGMVTKHSRLKSNPTIAMFVAKRAAERASDLGFTRLYVRTRGKTGIGHGPGVNSAVKSLSKSFEIVSILDTTKVPRGGPKVKGGRRGRRV